MKKDSITMIKLTASEGHILTNGENFARVAFLPSNDDGSMWYEITEAEYEKIIKEKEAEGLENKPV